MTSTFRIFAGHYDFLLVIDQQTIDFAHRWNSNTYPSLWFYNIFDTVHMSKMFLSLKRFSTHIQFTIASYIVYWWRWIFFNVFLLHACVYKNMSVFVNILDLTWFVLNCLMMYFIVFCVSSVEPFEKHKLNEVRHRLYDNVTLQDYNDVTLQQL